MVNNVTILISYRVTFSNRNLMLIRAKKPSDVPEFVDSLWEAFPSLGILYGDELGGGM